MGIGLAQQRTAIAQSIKTYRRSRHRRYIVDVVQRAQLMIDQTQSGFRLVQHFLRAGACHGGHGSGGGRQESVYLFFQNLRRERFHNVVVDPGFHCHENIVAHRASGDHEHGNVLAIAAQTQRSGKFCSAHGWHVPVSNDEFDGMVKLCQRFRTVGGFDRFAESDTVQRVYYNTTHGRRIIDDKELHGRLEIAVSENPSCDLVDHIERVVGALVYLLAQLGHACGIHLGAFVRLGT